MSNPTLETACCDLPSLDPAVIIPTTCPAALTSGPPESPGWIGASISMTLPNDSVPPRPSLTVMDCPRFEMLPWVTVGVPPWPSALPMATTSWPTERVEESARVTVGSPDKPWICRSATSSVGSTPMTLAAYVPWWPSTVTRMLVALRITWLLVSTWPVEVTTIPVPAASAVLPEASTRMVVLMSTTAGST